LFVTNQETKGARCGPPIGTKRKVGKACPWFSFCGVSSSCCKVQEEQGQWGEKLSIVVLLASIGTCNKGEVEKEKEKKKKKKKKRTRRKGKKGRKKEKKGGKWARMWSSTLPSPLVFK